MWVLIALLGNTTLALVGIIDKLILTKAVSKPVVLVFYSTIFILPVFLVLPFGVVTMPLIGAHYVLSLVSGFCFALGLWAMYLAITKGEVSRIGPIIGAVTPFFILFLSRFFLGEKLGPYALLAAIFLMIGSLIISIDTKEGASSWRSGLEWATVSGFLFAISHVSAKYIYNQYDFVSGFVLTKLPIGIFAIFLFLSPSVRALFTKKKESSPLAPVVESQEVPVKKILGKYQVLLVGGNILLGALGAVLLQYAMSIGSVSLVNALAGVQFAMLIVLVAIISKFFPQILKETFTKKEVVQKVVAVSFISIGLLLLLM